VSTRNDDAVVREVTQLFLEYERALREGDLDFMAESFDVSEDLVRFGINDMQRGPEELAKWRRDQPALAPGRTLHETLVKTYGSDAAVVTTLFTYPGRAKLGRQSQTWIREQGRWKIVHAHVSEIDAP
jgi:ketosteroid isomerase-like protein